MTLEVKATLSSEIPTPEYASDGAACFDFRALKSGTVWPGCNEIFGTGLTAEVPEGHVMLVFSRSGHGFKNEVTLLNCVGVIDSDYRNEIKIGLRNDGSVPLKIEAGDRIAQGLVFPIPRVKFKVVDKLSETARGEGGFGSTGVK